MPGMLRSWGKCGEQGQLYCLQVPIAGKSVRCYNNSMSEKRDEGLQELTTLMSGLADADYCYLTTTGRVSGHPHEIEIWFGLRERTLYLLSGNGASSDWVKNIQAQAVVQVRIAKYTFKASARIIKDAEEENAARELLDGKYEKWKPGQPFSEWAQTALPVALDVEGMA